jgi:hypothetical protein
VQETLSASQVRASALVSSTPSQTEQIRAGLRAHLLAARNPDGGWPYAAGRSSRLEPTCWALLALAHTGGSTADQRVLDRWPRQNGWLVDVPGVAPNQAFNALAVLTLLQQGRTPAELSGLCSSLIGAKGLTAQQFSELRQDNSLQGWSWVEGTASWVEPTAWGLLVMKRLRSSGSGISGVDARIEQGERLLLDRVCEVGGWNYGNSNVYGQQLWPYVPTTALGLLAMVDVRDHPLVVRSLEQLQRDARGERSASALALTLICLRAYDVTVDVAMRDLVAFIGEPARSERRADDLLGQAMTLYALGDRGGGSFPW